MNDYTQEKSGTKKDPLWYQQTAQAFVEDAGLIPLKYRDHFYRYQDNRYIEDNELADKVRRWLTKNKIGHSNNVVGNIVPAIGALGYRDSSVYDKMPFYLGAEDWPAHILAYSNGLLDLDAYAQGCTKLLPHSWKWVSTVCLPHEFQPEADCPLWLKFLDEVFEGDSDRQLLLQEWFGYCLVHDTSQHKLMLKIGPARAGKGTTDRVQQALLGRENYTGFSLHSLAERFGTFQLVNKLLAFIGEVNLVGKERFAIMEKLNNIVGEDPVGVEEKHNPRNLSQTLPTRFSISCNEMPTFVDPAGALAARLLVVDYNKSFAGREDRELTAKLLTEISGINSWALQGYVRLRRQGTFSVPARSKALALKVRRNNSDAFAFLMDCLVVHHRLNPGGLEGVQFTDESVSVDTHTLGEAYQAWRAENQRDESSNNWLMRNLKVLLPKLDEDGNVSRKRIPCPYDPHHKTMQVQVYQGIGLKPDEPAAPSPMDAIYAPEHERGSATAPTTV